MPVKLASLVALGLSAVLLLSVGLSLANDPRPVEPGETRSWRTAARHSAGIAPDPVRHADTAIVQVYAAATYGWRGYFAVHPWIIYKRAGDTAYTRYDVDRSARRTGPEQTAPEHTTPARTAERDAAAFNPPDRRPASTAPAISM